MSSIWIPDGSEPTGCVNGSLTRKRFPDPKGFIQRLKTNGYRVSLWQLPYVAEDAEQIEEAKANEYIAPLTKQQDTDGSNFSALDYAGTIDFTYPKATEWYKGLLKQLLDMGVTWIKTDFGENIHMDAVYKGMKPELLNNLVCLALSESSLRNNKGGSRGRHLSGHVPLGRVANVIRCTGEV